MFVVQINYQNVFIIFVVDVNPLTKIYDFIPLFGVSNIRYFGICGISFLYSFKSGFRFHDISIFSSKICTLSMFTPDHLYWVVPPPHEPAPPTNYATIPQYNPQYQPNTITPMYLEIYAQLRYHTHNVPRDIYPTSLQYPKLLTTKHAFGKILFLYCWHSLHQSEQNLSNYWWQELWNYIGAIKWKKC